MNIRRKDSRGHLWKGFALLGLGSVVLLCCKLPLPLWADKALVLLGGGMLLLGNGHMLFGLLIHADSRTYASDAPASPPDTRNAQAVPDAASDISPASDAADPANTQ